MVHGGSDLCAGVLRKGPIVCQIAIIINSSLTVPWKQRQSRCPDDDDDAAAGAHTKRNNHWPSVVGCVHAVKFAPQLTFVTYALARSRARPPRR